MEVEITNLGQGTRVVRSGDRVWALSRLRGYEVRVVVGDEVTKEGGNRAGGVGVGRGRKRRPSTHASRTAAKYE